MPGMHQPLRVKALKENDEQLPIVKVSYLKFQLIVCKQDTFVFCYSPCLTGLNFYIFSRKLVGGLDGQRGMPGWIGKNSLE